MILMICRQPHALMWMDVDDFLRIRCLFWAAGPILWQYEDSCLLTMENAETLNHAVMGGDGRVYDAYALHKWLTGGNRHVIPDCRIDVVYLSSMWAYVGVLAMTFFQAAFALAHRVCATCASSFRQRIHELRIAPRTPTTRSESREVPLLVPQFQQRHARRRGVCIPSSGSAFSWKK